MVKLEEFKTEDFNKLISWIENDELLMQFAGSIFKYPLTHEQLEVYLGDKNRYAFKVIDIITNDTIGHAEVYLKEPKVALLCRILIGDKKYRGQRLGQQLVGQLTSYSFNKFDIEVVELNVYDWNISAIRCYEKVGFELNPNKVKETIVDNETWIAINMFINKNKFEEVKDYS